MKAVDFARTSIELSYQWIIAIARDAQDIALTRPAGDVGNHPLWCVGHMAVSEGNLYHWITGKPNPAIQWESLFLVGSQPKDQSGEYPSYAEVLAKYDEVHQTLLAALDSLSDEDLDGPSHAGEEMKAWFGTVGQCLAVVPVHLAFHGGQMAVVRSAAGRSPVMG